jgi:hypothetical protein
MKALAAGPETGRSGSTHHSDFHVHRPLRWCQDLHRPDVRHQRWNGSSLELFRWHGIRASE